MREKLKTEKSKLVTSNWYLVAGIFVFLTILLDQISKAFVVSSHFPFVCNQGFAFGIRLGILNSLTVILVISACIYFFGRESVKTRRFGYLLVIGGGISNLVDRIVRGCVVDFIDFKIWPSLTGLIPSLTWWPAFNLADAVISLGVVILIVSFIYRKNSING